MSVYVFQGQGSQQVGMGETLFQKYDHLTCQASDTVGYSIRELCVEDPNGVLDQTEYTQVALFVVNALRYLEEVRRTGVLPDFLAGHSIGEYNALFAAGAFDFVTGVELVAKRGELMAQASSGGLCAVLGLNADVVESVVESDSFHTLDVANYNTPTQTVVAGPQDELDRAVSAFEDRGAEAVVPLRVSAAFHSRYMNEAAEQFSRFLDGYEMARLRIPVVANVTARPYDEGNVARILSQQINSSVRWTESIQYLLDRGDPRFVEIGEGTILMDMIDEIRSGRVPV